MNQENQNIEWKESWRDEYLKWICGFANAQGGKIYIGKTDNGDIVDLKDAAKLLEDIPNKVRDVLGILVNVNLLTENDKKYLEIEVEAYPSPVSYKGQYHYRSGSTKQEFDLKTSDKALDKDPKTSDKTSDKDPKTSDKTSDKILDLIKVNPKITIKELAELTIVSARVIETHLQNLKQNHKIIRKGGKKIGAWELL